MYCESYAAPAAVITEPTAAAVLSQAVIEQGAAIVEEISTALSILEQAGVAIPDENACPKCGRALKKQGRHFHVRRCQGVPNG